MIVPAESGTNNSAPFSPTIDGCPTGGRPPFSNPFILFAKPKPKAKKKRREAEEEEKLKKNGIVDDVV